MPGWYRHRAPGARMTSTTKVTFSLSPEWDFREQAEPGAYSLPGSASGLVPGARRYGYEAQGVIFLHAALRDQTGCMKITRGLMDRLQNAAGFLLSLVSAHKARLWRDGGHQDERRGGRAGVESAPAPRDGGSPWLRLPPNLRGGAPVSVRPHLLCPGLAVVWP